jgi:phosphogluconate dehydratase
MHAVIQAVTKRIVERSLERRDQYLQQMQKGGLDDVRRSRVSCGNWAHTFAICDDQAREQLKNKQPHIGIVTAYNDMLSAHQPYQFYPEQVKTALGEVGATAQVAGGVPAMCDGVTQGQKGMELSLMSRDVIALSTAVSLSHNVFDGAVMLGICDKIVPGLLIGALKFAYLPMLFIPAGPMKSGIPNKEKAKVRQAFAKGEVGEDALLDVETKSYHSPGTCTFYGTANTNQILMEVMGLHLPGAAFVNPDSPLRTALNRQAALRMAELCSEKQARLMDVVTEKSLVNAIVALLATGGSTNLTIHLIAIARSAGIILTWEDMAELSEVVPLLCRMYPNGEADINHFHQAGGTPFLFRQLLELGLLHNDVVTIMGAGLDRYCEYPVLDNDSEKNNSLQWRPCSISSGDDTVLRKADQPFADSGGIKLIRGNLGAGISKISAIAQEHREIHAPALVFDDQNDVVAAHKAGLLNQDFICLLRYQGPKANGMPELHKLMPILGALQDEGFKVALVTDGRLSGASGKVPNVIHISTEAVLGGAIAKVQSGDMIYLNLESGELRHEVNELEFDRRIVAQQNCHIDSVSLGTELFDGCRRLISGAESGASFLFDE